MTEAAMVLIVDDEPSIREVVTLYLQRAGYQVMEAGDGDAALRVMTAGMPDLVVLDLMLPKLSGLEVLRWVRSQGNTPVIVLTSRGQEIDRVFGLEMGADDYVVKPFSPSELVSRVKAVLRRTHIATPETAVFEQERSRPIEHGDLIIDPGTRLVTVGGEERELTATEFDLLWTLASRPRRVFNRDQLLDQVWGVSDYIDPSSVTVHIHRIREKIESNPAKPRHIQTVWGVGYRFEP
jgi:DNA-binding response OmpR family regulator